MKTGISKIEYIDSRDLYDYGALPPNSSLSMSGFIKTGKAFSELPFTMSSANLSEQWSEQDGGKASEVAFSASIRAQRDRYRSVLQRMTGRKCVFRITLVSGERCIIGSPQYVPSFSYDESVSGISSCELSLSITNRSKHGMFFDQDS